MSTPDEIVQQQLAEGLQVTGEVAAPIYGDQANAAHPPAELDLSKATPTTADIEALQAQITAMQAAQAAAAAAVAPEPEEAPVNPAPVLSGSVASDVQAAIASLHDRLAAVEDKLKDL